MKPEKYVNLGFYQVEPSNDGLAENRKSARKKLVDAFNAPPAKYQSIEREDESSVSLLRGKLHSDKNGLVYGTLIHNQKNDIPFTFDDATQVGTPLEIEDGKGLGYETSFIFDPETCIVMIESVKNGVGIGSFCNFFEKNLNVPGLEYAVVINPSEINKLNSMTSITKFEVKVANLQSGDIFGGKNVSAKQVMNAADDTNTDILEMVLSVGYNRDSSLSLRTIKAYVRDFLKLKSEDKKELKKLLVSGKEGDDSKTDTIDLIQQRMKDGIWVPRVRLNSLEKLDARYELLTNTYLPHRKMLTTAYKLKTH